MRRHLLFVFMLLGIFYSISAQDLNVMTFNIRYNTNNDSLNAWSYRKDKAASEILFHEVHLLGVQEALHNQMVDLKERLKQYKYVGIGRDVGRMVRVGDGCKVCVGVG